MFGTVMFGDDPKTPTDTQPPPAPQDATPVKTKEDDTKETFRFTDWAQI